MLQSINDKTHNNFWRTSKCNEIIGTFDYKYPASWIENRSPIDIYRHDMCRKLIYSYHEGQDVSNSCKLRYVLNLNNFANSKDNPENACYCTEDGCPPSGMHNMSTCAHNTPIHISYPHFYGGIDDKIRKIYNNLNPNQSLHESYFDIDVKSGEILRSVQRFQINFELTDKSLAVTNELGLYEYIYIRKMMKI